MKTVEIAGYLDELLSTASVPDFPNALNGLQLDNAGDVTSVAAAVDYSLETVRKAAEMKSSLLILHHGMFWSGLRPFVGAQRSKLQVLLQNNIAVYSSHIPLDLHATFGNNVLLCRELGLTYSDGFAFYKGVPIGLRGEEKIPTAELVERARSFARKHGGEVIASGRPLGGATTQKWGMCTGAGASSDTLAEVAAAGIDTLIVGEGPHHTAVEASDLGITIIYAGHYATETLGVRALATHLGEKFGLAVNMIDSPTGL